MRSAGRQRPLFSRHPPEVEARANRISAETELMNPFYTKAERERRAAHYIAEAERIERAHGITERT